MDVEIEMEREEQINRHVLKGISPLHRRTANSSGICGAVRWAGSSRVGAEAAAQYHLLPFRSLSSAVKAL